MRAAQKGVDRNADAGKVLGDHRRFRGASGNFLRCCLIRVFNKTLKSVLLGRRIAASGHCR